MKKFDRNVPFNDLSDLPPSDDMFDKDILFKWGIASRALAELNRNIMRMPNPTMLVNTITLQEAQTSTAIENIFTTDDELYKAVSILEAKASKEFSEAYKEYEMELEIYKTKSKELKNNKDFDNLLTQVLRKE